MPETNNSQRRYSDDAKRMGISEKTIFEHDMNGGVLRLIELLNKGKSLEKAKSLIGTRQEDEDECCLSDFSEFILLSSIQEWMDQNRETTKTHPQSFRLSTEQIRFALVEAISEKSLALKIDRLEFSEFNALIMGVRKKQQSVLEKYRSELEK